MENEISHIKPLISNNALDEKNFTQTGAILALMSGKYGVCNNHMKVPKNGVANGRCL